MRAEEQTRWCVSDVFNWVTVVFSAAGSLRQVVCISCSASRNSFLMVSSSAGRDKLPLTPAVIFTFDCFLFCFLLLLCRFSVPYVSVRHQFRHKSNDLTVVCFYFTQSSYPFFNVGEVVDLGQVIQQQQQQPLERAAASGKSRDDRKKAGLGLIIPLNAHRKLDP